MRLIDEQTLADIAAGAVILGSGGGGDPYVGMLLAREAIRRHGPVEVIALEALDDDDLLIPCAMMGAPAVIVEKLPTADGLVTAIETLVRFLGRQPRATLSVEIGGFNSVVPIYAAACLGLPMVDCDGTGRAFPEVQMSTFNLHGMSATPFAMADEHGNRVLLETVDARSTETLARVLTVQMGAVATVAGYPATGRQLKEAAVPATLSQVRRIGEGIRLARLDGSDPVEAVRAASGGFHIFSGKVRDVDRRTEGGFSVGSASADGVDADAGKQLRLDFQNEFLAARLDGDFAVTTPDIITVVDLDSGRPFTAEGLRYGYRIAVIGIPCTGKWRTPDGLALAGPSYFGYQTDYQPVEQAFG